MVASAATATTASAAATATTTVATTTIAATTAAATTITAGVPTTAARRRARERRQRPAGEETVAMERQASDAVPTRGRVRGRSPPRLDAPMRRTERAEDQVAAARAMRTAREDEIRGEERGDGGGEE